MSLIITVLHPISANVAKKSVAVNAPRASLFVIPAFVSLKPFSLRRAASAS